MDRFSRDALMRVIFLLIGLVVGILDYFITRPGAPTDPMDSFSKAFAVTAFLFIGELVLEIRDAQERTTHQYRDFVRRNRNMTGAVVSQIYSDLERSLRPADGQFVIQHETLAILSYDTFWRLLVNEAESGKARTVQTIHSCAIDVWLNHPLTASLINRQREFCELPGTKVMRIICGKTDVPEPDVQEAADKMAAAGVEVYYYNLASLKIVDHNFAWDFARVNETGDAAIWDSFTAAAQGVIGEAV